MKRTRSRDAFRGHEDAPLLRIASIVFWYRPVVVSAARLVLPEVEITATELAQKSRKDLGQCHQKEIEFQNTRNQRLQIGFFAESHAAAIKHIAIMVEKTMRVVKAYFKLRAVTAAKPMASAHAVRRMRAKISAGRPPSCHANTAANKRNTEKKSPKALKKSQ